MKHLILIGACYLDTILREEDWASRPRLTHDTACSNLSHSVPRYPEEDSKLRASEIKIRRGGNCPNSLEVLQQFLGQEHAVRPYLVSPLPGKSSPATQRIIASFGEVSVVDFRHCLYRESHAEAASSYIVRSEETGSRTIVNYNDLPEMTVDEFEAVVRGFKASDDTWWHFEGRIPDTALECMRLLRDRLPGPRISVEIEKAGREGLPELAAEADVVFYSRAWAESRGHGSAESCLKNEERPNAFLALCTWGAEGAAALSRSSQQVVRCPVESRARPISVVDAVGAGDTFIAGMLYSLVCREKAWDISHGLRFAANLATVKVQREGLQGLGKDVHEWLRA